MLYVSGASFIKYRWCVSKCCGSSWAAIWSSRFPWSVSFNAIKDLPRNQKQWIRLIKFDSTAGLNRSKASELSSAYKSKNHSSFLEFLYWKAIFVSIFHHFCENLHSICNFWDQNVPLLDQEKVQVNHLKLSNHKWMLILPLGSSSSPKMHCPSAATN